MSDLIKRMKSKQRVNYVPARQEYINALEANAAEIERLKGLLDKFVYLEDNPNYVDPLEAENEKLRDDIESHKEAHRTLVDMAAAKVRLLEG